MELSGEVITTPFTFPNVDLWIDQVEFPLITKSRGALVQIYFRIGS
ncbi:hypothetical protein EPK97_00405 [Chengkuizengella sediminis]|nr:hypothetical protein [Chengkuizengella sediminis]